MRKAPGARLKWIFVGRLVPVPVEILPEYGEPVERFALPSDRPIKGHKVLYVTAIRTGS